MKKKFIEGAYFLLTMSLSEVATSYTMLIYSITWEPVSLNVMKKQRKVMVFMHTEGCKIFDQVSKKLKKTKLAWLYYQFHTLQIKWFCPQLDGTALLKQKAKRMHATKFVK